MVPHTSMPKGVVTVLGDIVRGGRVVVDYRKMVPWEVKCHGSGWGGRRITGER